MDDSEFLAELEKMEAAPVAPAADRAGYVARTAAAAAAPVPPVVRRDVDRFQRQHESAPPVAEPADEAPASLVPAFLTILIGLSAGAVSSALIFHDRVRWLLALWSH